MLILAFESSCDETAVAVVRDGRQVLSDAILSQADMHALYGGVVPEIASRKHVEAIAALADQALRDAGVGKSDIDAVAVTYGPGLIGALLVGVSFAKSVCSLQAADSSPPSPGAHCGQLSGVSGTGAALPGPVHFRGQHHAGGCPGVYGDADCGGDPGRRGRGVL